MTEIDIIGGYNQYIGNIAGGITSKRAGLSAFRTSGSVIAGHIVFTTCCQHDS
jgi:hypothetical protein